MVVRTVLNVRTNPKEPRYDFDSPLTMVNKKKGKHGISTMTKILENNNQPYYETINAILDTTVIWSLAFGPLITSKWWRLPVAERGEGGKQQDSLI